MHKTIAVIKKKIAELEKELSVLRPDKNVPITPNDKDIINIIKEIHEYQHCITVLRNL